MTDDHKIFIEIRTQILDVVLDGLRLAKAFCPLEHGLDHQEESSKVVPGRPLPMLSVFVSVELVLVVEGILHFEDS